MIQRIPYGVVQPTRFAERPQHVLRVLYCGRIVQEQKRILDTVRVACQAVQQGLKMEFDFIGDGPQFDECKKRVEESGASQSIRFLGQRTPSEIRSRLPDYHVFLLLSDYEGLSIALLEAASHGLVPICTEVNSGVGEVVRNGENGFVVREREPQVIDILKRLNQQSEIWERCSTAIRQSALSYDVERCADQWRRMFEELMRLPRCGIRASWMRRMPAFSPEFVFDDRRSPRWTWRDSLRKRFL